MQHLQCQQAAQMLLQQQQQQQRQQHVAVGTDEWSAVSGLLMLAGCN
jgi:hypothetical protein